VVKEPGRSAGRFDRADSRDRPDVTTIAGRNRWLAGEGEGERESGQTRQVFKKDSIFFYRDRLGREGERMERRKDGGTTLEESRRPLRE